MLSTGEHDLWDDKVLDHCVFAGQGSIRRILGCVTLSRNFSSPRGRGAFWTPFCIFGNADPPRPEAPLFLDTNT